MLLHEFEDYNSYNITLNYATTSQMTLSAMRESSASVYLLDGFWLSVDDMFFVILNRAETGEEVSVTAYSALGLLKRRIAKSQTIEGTIDHITKTLITANTQGKRWLPITCAEIHNDGDSHKYTAEQGKLNSEVEEVMNLGGEYGIKTTFNGSGFTFDTYIGADRSTENTEENEPVIFAVKYDNLLSYSRETGNFDTVNVVYVEEDEGVITEYDPLGATGLDRYESTASVGEDPETGEKSTVEDTGEAEMVLPTDTINGTVAPYTFVYGVDYFIGDIVTVEHKAKEAYLTEDGDYDVREITRRYALRITSVSIENRGGTVTYTPTFGTPSYDLGDVIKKQIKNERANAAAIRAANVKIAAIQKQLS